MAADLKGIFGCRAVSGIETRYFLADEDAYCLYASLAVNVKLCVENKIEYKIF